MCSGVPTEDTLVEDMSGLFGANNYDWYRLPRPKIGFDTRTDLLWSGGEKGGKEEEGEKERSNSRLVCL